MRKMDIIDKLKEMGSEAYKFTQESTTKIAKETKLKMKIAQNKSKINDYYEEIGKEIYKDHLCEKETDVKEKVDELIGKIDGLTDEIEQIQVELLSLKDRKKCEACGKEIEKESKFCPECGSKQKEVAKEEEKEAEVVEDDIEENNNNENSNYIFLNDDDGRNSDSEEKIDE
jgi:rRNA maturation endonuclease Nob1